jgi:hypothetical protein
LPVAQLQHVLRGWHAQPKRRLRIQQLLLERHRQQLVQGHPWILPKWGSKRHGAAVRRNGAEVHVQLGRTSASAVRTPLFDALA